MSIVHLFVPADHPARVAKALASQADVVILDLEDGVAPQNKADARSHVADILQQQRNGPAVWVRCNNVNSPFWVDDLALLRRIPPDGIMLAKAESTEDIRIVAYGISGAEIIPLIESAIGVSRVQAMAEASSRIKKVAFGSVDFALDLGVAWTPNGEERRYAMGQIVLTSRVAGLQPPIDAVFPDVRDEAAFRRDASLGRNMGFHGKMLIHPCQIEWLQSVYQPSPEDLAWAQRIVASFEASSGQPVLLEGKMIDTPVAERARRILASAQSYR